MPKIEAPTVAEHHAQVEGRLVDAAEGLLRERRPLTAAAVSAAAGIARNSIYRYVESVDDLRGLVVARYLPAWLAAVRSAMEAAPDAGGRVAAWVRTNLDQAAASGHGWLMDAVRSQPTGRTTANIDQAHTGMRDDLGAAWLQLLDGDGQRARIAASFSMGILEGGFRELEAGVDPRLVSEVAERATLALVSSLAQPRRG